MSADRQRQHRGHHLRRGPVLIALSAVAGMALLAGCFSVKPSVKPQWLRPDNRPLPVEGAANGLLTPEQVEEISERCRIEKSAAASLKEMVTEAQKEDIVLVPSSCYRDLAGQVLARSSWCGAGRCHMAAAPGTSNHGWGRAVDFADEEGTLQFDSRAFYWLKAHAHEYGWNHPGWAHQTGSAPEAWHWEWVGNGGALFPDGGDTPIPGTPDVPVMPAVPTDPEGGGVGDGSTASTGGSGGGDPSGSGAGTAGGAGGSGTGGGSGGGGSGGGSTGGTSGGSGSTGGSGTTSGTTGGTGDTGDTATTGSSGGGSGGSTGGPGTTTPSSPPSSNPSATTPTSAPATVPERQSTNPLQVTTAGQ